MKRLLLGLMLLVTAGAASAEWTRAGSNDDFIYYVDRATIRRNGNLVKMWILRDFKSAQKHDGTPYLSERGQNEYDCKEENYRILAFTFFAGKMGDGKVVYNTSKTSMKWSPIAPGSVAETLWKIACGKK